MNTEDLTKANEGIKSIPVKNKNYVMVNERVKGFRRAVPGGSIQTEILTDDGEKVIIKASVYDETGFLLATGTAFELKSTSYINKSSYIENCETSAVGRALGFVGIGIDDSMGSADELTNALAQQNEMKKAETGGKQISETKAVVLKKTCEGYKDLGLKEEKILKHFGVESFGKMTESQFIEAMNMMQSYERKRDGI